MTVYELTVVEHALRHALNNGATGLSDAIKTAIITSTSRRLTHELNIPGGSSSMDPMLPKKEW
jgi:predicted YcjX-like family ATPase